MALVIIILAVSSSGPKPNFAVTAPAIFFAIAMVAGGIAADQIIRVAAVSKEVIKVGINYKILAALMALLIIALAVYSSGPKPNFVVTATTIFFILTSITAGILADQITRAQAVLSGGEALTANDCP